MSKLRRTENQESVTKRRRERFPILPLAFRDLDVACVILSLCLRQKLNSKLERQGTRSKEAFEDIADLSRITAAWIALKKVYFPRIFSFNAAVGTPERYLYKDEDEDEDEDVDNDEVEDDDESDYPDHAAGHEDDRATGREGDRV